MLAMKTRFQAKGQQLMVLASPQRGGAVLLAGPSRAGRCRSKLLFGATLAPNSKFSDVV
jgi:hypothetical protein